MKYSFVVEEYRRIKFEELKLLKPNVPDEVLNELIDRMIEENFINPNIQIHNNYTNELVGGNNKRRTLNQFLRWYEKEKPITTEHGVMFKDHSKAPNHNGDMLGMFLDERKVNKKLMLKAKEQGDEAEAEMRDTMQKVYKILANSYYGVLGQSSSIFYNLFVALSVTGKGQSIISTAMTTFENFLTGSIKYKNTDELMTFVLNVKKQDKYKVNLSMPVPTDEELKAKLINDCKPNILGLENVIDRVIESCDDEEKTILFYKNNFFGYLRDSNVLALIKEIIDDENEFRSSEHAHENIKPLLTDLWLSVDYYVFYNYIKFDKINILKHDEREAVLGVDTDSNFLALYNHYKIIQTELNLDEDDEEIVFKIVSTISYLLSNVITEAYWLYTTNCNVPEDKRPIIAMKNEFLWKRLVLTQNKKSYASIVRLQEGVLLDNKLDVKGLQIRKSNVNKYTRKELQRILEEKILKPKKIKLSEVVEDLFALEDRIRQSFLDGEIEFCSPGNSKKPSEYANPESQSNYRAACLYNLIYPEDPIMLPESFNAIRLRIRSLDDPKLMNLREINFKAYSNIVDYLFELPSTYVKNTKIHKRIDNEIKGYFLDESISFEEAIEKSKEVLKNNIETMIDTVIDKDLSDSAYDKEFEKKLKAFNKALESKVDTILKAKYNTNLLALPKSINKIPEWVIPLIDIDEILKNNISTFLPLFASVGGRTVQFTKDDKFVTNIIL